MKILFNKSNIFIIALVLLAFCGKTIGQTTSGAAYIWSTTTSWTTNVVPSSGSSVTVNHSLTLNQNLTIGTGNYIFNQDVTDQPGGSNYNLTNLNAAGSLTIASGTTTIEGITDIGGNATFTLTVKNGATLVLGSPGSTSNNFLIGNKANITIEQGATLIVYGNIVNSNSTGAFIVNGLLQVYGDYITDNGNIDISGATGQFYTTGAMTTQGNSSQIYGSSNNCVSNCSGTSLGCGTSNPDTAYTAIITPQSQIVCSGNTASMTFTTNAPSTTYQWESSLTAGGTYTSISGQTSNTYTTSSLTVTRWYRVKYTSSASGCGTKYSAPVPVYVSASTYTQSTAGQTICGGTFGPISVSAFGTDLTYQWYSNDIASNSGGSLISGETSNIYTPSSAIGGTKYYYCVINSSCGVFFNTAVSGAFTVNLNSAGAASLSPTLCVNTVMTSITHSTIGSTGIGTATGLPSGVSASWSSNTITISGTPTVSGTFGYSIPLTGGCGTVNATGTIVVSPTPSAPSVTITQPTCAVPTATVTITSVAGETYSFDNSSYSGTLIYSGLAQGSSHTIYAKNATGCISLVTNVGISSLVTNTWRGVLSGWDKTTPPTADQKIVFDSTDLYTLNSDIVACSCEAKSDVTVKSGHTLTLTNELTVAGFANVVFEDGASLVQINNVANSGDIDYERTTNTVVRKSDYIYWSSPVSPQTLEELYPLGGTFYSYEVTATGEDWKPETAGTEMAAGKGYIANQGAEIPSGVPPPPGLFSVTFVGEPNNGPYEINGIFADKSYLLGNPYPSALDADEFLAANASVLNGTLYFWTHNTQIGIGLSDPGTGLYAYSGDDYATYNATGGVGAAPPDLDPLTGQPYPGPAPSASTGGINNNTPSGKIASGQGFFASSKISISDNKIVFDNTMRVGVNGITGDNTQFFKTKNLNAKSAKSIEKNRVWLNLTNTQGAFKQTLVGYVTDATNDYDDRFDGESFDGNKFVDFYSINQDKNLVIQGRALPFDENDEVPLGFRTTINGAFTINIDQVDGLLTNQSVFLEDKMTNTVFDLKRGNYTFNTIPGTFNDRFVLKFSNKTLGTSDLDTLARTVLVSNKNKQIKINSSIETIDKVTIYDLLGRQIFQKTNVNNNELSISNLVSSHQVILVKTLLQNGQEVSNKIVY